MLTVTQLTGFAASDLEAGGGGGGPTELMLWNSADKAPGITLYDSDKEAFHESATNEYVRATKSMTSGKYCWAFHNDSAISWRAGICTTGFDLSTGTPGTGTTNVSVSATAVVVFNGTTLSDNTDYAMGDVVLMGFDADTGEFWLGRNTTWIGDPAAGTGEVATVTPGTWLPYFGATGAATTVKVTLIPFPAVAHPSGFTALQPGPTIDDMHWETVHFQIINSANAGWNGFNLRQLLTAAQLIDKTGSKIRFRLKGQSAAGENAQVSAAHFGLQAGAGDAYDMSTAGTALTISASNAFTINAQTLVQSDDITFAYTGTTGLLINFHFNNASHDTIGSLIVSGYTQYHKSAAAETSTADVTGYTSTANTLRLVQEVQVYVAD